MFEEEQKILERIDHLSSLVSYGCEVPVVVGRDDTGRWILVINDLPACVSNDVSVLWTYLEGTAKGVSEALNGGWEADMREYQNGRHGGARFENMEHMLDMPQIAVVAGGNDAGQRGTQDPT